MQKLSTKIILVRGFLTKCEPRFATAAGRVMILLFDRVNLKLTKIYFFFKIFYSKLISVFKTDSSINTKHLGLHVTESTSDL